MASVSASRIGLVASFVVADHGLGGTLDAGDARPIADGAMLSDRVLPYEIQSARDVEL
ncbi:MAG: hypothetical protein M3461_01660 [Pseudomonadota bacterium]|nr:hypothetical protein [Pseudomonadota bacterium]